MDQRRQRLVWGLDGSRCETRFLSTRGKHWDIMLWTFYCSHGMGQHRCAVAEL